MKTLCFIFTLAIGFSLMSQSKKEQIYTLTNRLDSLSKQYAKDAVLLGSAKQKIDGEYKTLTKEYAIIQKQIKTQSATITEKSSSIRSLNATNRELMNEERSIYKSLQELNSRVEYFERMRDSLILVQNEIEMSNAPFEILSINNLPKWAKEQGCSNCILLSCSDCQPILLMNQGKAGMEYVYFESLNKTYKIPIQSKNIDQGSVIFTYSDNIFFVKIRMYSCPYSEQNKCGDVSIVKDGMVVFFSNQIKTRH
jgi:hypothetical protein